MAVKSVNAKKILDKSLEIANQTSWKNLSLFEVAHALNISLLDIEKYYRSKDEISAAWFREATEVMLTKAKVPHLKRLSVRERLHFLIISWLEALSPYQNVTKEMVYNKLDPGHLHGKVEALKAIHNIVSWLIEAVQMEKPDKKYKINEVGLATIFVSTFTYWLYDHSKEFENTRRFLSKELNAAETLSHFAEYWQEPISKIKVLFQKPHG